jgi:hypothetical protein
MDRALLGFRIFCRIPFEYLHGTIVPAENFGPSINSVENTDPTREIRIRQSA